MPGKVKPGTNDGNGKKGGSLPVRPSPEEEAAAAREHSEDG
jgi:hypothetical protein